MDLHGFDDQPGLRRNTRWSRRRIGRRAVVKENARAQRLRWSRTRALDRELAVSLPVLQLRRGTLSQPGKTSQGKIFTRRRHTALYPTPH